MAVLAQGLPLALGLASHAMINLVDLAMVGRLGEDAVRAAHVGSTWNFLPMIVGQCLSTALLSRLSRRAGEADRGGARRLNLQAQWLMVWLGLLVAVATSLPADAMVARTGLTGPVAADAAHYLLVSNLGCLPMFVLMQTTAAMRACGEAAVPLVLLLLANVLNLLLAALLLYGAPTLGVPAIGVVGAAYAALIARTLGAVVAVLWLRRASHPLSLRGVPAGPTEPVLRPLTLDALPQALQIGLRASVFLLMTAFVQHRFGDSATAALGITTRFDTVVLFSSLGFANAATAYAGRAVMLGNVAAARAAGLWAGVQAGLLGTVFVLLLIALDGPLVACFVAHASPGMTEVAVQYFHIGAWSQVLGAVALGAMGAVQGAGRMMAPLVVDLIAFPVGLGLMVWAVLHEAPLRDLFVVLVAGMGLVAVLHLLLVARGRWPYRA